MTSITRFALITGTMLSVASPALAQGGAAQAGSDTQWIRDLEAQIEASASAVAQAVAAQVAGREQVDRDRIKAEKDRIRAERDRAKALADQKRQGPEYTEPFTKTVRLGQKGMLDLTTIAGAVTINAGGGDDVKIDAVKRVRGANEADARALMKDLAVQINERTGLVEVRTQFPRRVSFPFITIDYTVTVPSGTSLTLKTVSGDVLITGVRGDIMSNSVNGDVTVRNSRPRAIDVETVSGAVRFDSVDSERVQLRSISGDIDYVGKLARSGRYDMQSHSGDIHIVASDSPGFDIEATTFSGDVRSDYPLAIRSTQGNGFNGGFRMNHSLRGSFGDASAILTLRSFSGDISVSKK